MTDNELRAVIAHELGHLVNDTVKKVSRIDNFLYNKDVFNETTIQITICLTLYSILGIIGIAIDHKNATKGIKRHPYLSVLMGLCLACPIILSAAFAYALWIKRHNPTHEVDADQIAIDVTNDPESFVLAMEAIKKSQIQYYENMDNDIAIFDEVIPTLKDVSEDWYNILNNDMNNFKEALVKAKKDTLDDGTDTHPGTNKRIEFGKQEIEKRKQCQEAVSGGQA